MSNDINNQLVLIGGLSGAGKSASLRKIRNQKKWLYLNTEAGKRPPFKNEFQIYNISDPWQVYQGFDYATNDIPDEVDGIIVDSATFMMDMFESQYVLAAANTQKAWGDFAQFWKNLLQDKVVKFGKPTIFTAHIRDTLDEKAMEMKTSVPVKGSLANNGLEAYFSTVVYAKKITLPQLEKYKSDLLTISERDEILGYKHVFQTQPTKTTVGERIRSPMDMFSIEQTYMDNDAQLLLDHLNKFYNE